jgi:hypothetical protein
MRSERPFELVDFGRDLPTTAEDVAALRRLRTRGGTIEAYLRFLAALGPTTPDRLRRRPGPMGDTPFRLD